METTENAVIVLGGSFNPPTIAHMLVMEHAMAHTGTRAGLFVPSSHAYVARKARRQGSPYLFTEQERLDMLRAMIGTRDDMAVDACEYGDDGHGHTYRTLCAIRDRNPGRTICLLAGADKLSIIPRWRDAGALLDQFPIVVLSRGRNEAEAMIQADPFLRAHADAFRIIPGLPGIDAISSSRFQLMLSRNDSRAAHLVHPGVMGIVRGKLEARP